MTTKFQKVYPVSSGHVFATLVPVRMPPFDKTPFLAEIGADPAKSAVLAKAYDLEQEAHAASYYAEWGHLCDTGVIPPEGLDVRGIYAVFQPNFKFTPEPPFDPVPPPPATPKLVIPEDATLADRERLQSAYAASQQDLLEYRKKYLNTGDKPPHWRLSDRMDTQATIDAVGLMAKVVRQDRSLFKRISKLGLGASNNTAKQFEKSADPHRSTFLGYVAVSRGFHERVRQLVSSFKPHSQAAWHYRRLLQYAAKMVVERDAFPHGVEHLSQKQVTTLYTSVFAWLGEKGATCEVLEGALGNSNLGPRVRHLVDHHLTRISTAATVGLKQSIHVAHTAIMMSTMGKGLARRGGPDANMDTVTEAVMSSFKDQVTRPYVLAAVRRYMDTVQLHHGPQANLCAEVVRADPYSTPDANRDTIPDIGIGIPVAARASPTEVAIHAARAGTPTVTAVASGTPPVVKLPGSRRPLRSRNVTLIHP